MKIAFNFFAFFLLLGISVLLYIINTRTLVDRTSSVTIDKPIAVALSPEATAGKKLFNVNCASCHHRTREMTGPALKGITEKREKEWLYLWIRNNASLIASGDPLAIETGNLKPSSMNTFTQLTDLDIENILAYIEFQ